MKDMIPSWKCWIATPIAVAAVAMVLLLLSNLRKTANIRVDSAVQQQSRAEDTMLEIPLVDEVLELPMDPSPPSVAAQLAASMNPTPPAPIAVRELPSPNGAVASAEPQAGANANAPMLERIAPQEPIETVRLERELPAAQAAEFESLRNEGVALRLSTAGCIPGYEAEIPPDLVDSWLRRGLAQLIVVARHEGNAANGIWVFGGTLADPGQSRLIGSADEVRGFSTRCIDLSPTQGQILLRGVPVSRSGRMAVTPGILIRADLDAVVLAVQARVARDLNLPLEQLAMTYGRFRIVNGLPFTYEIDSVQTVDGQVLRAPLNASPAVHG